MIDQFTFDKCEDIAEALHVQAGLERALIPLLLDGLEHDQNLVHVAMSLVDAQTEFRKAALQAAEDIRKG